MKKIISFLIIVCMLITLSSCFIDSESPSNSTEQPGSSSSSELTQFSVIVNINFTENLLMNKYDSDFYIGDNKIGTMKHGVGECYTIELSEGKHDFTFTKAGEKAISGKTQVNIDKDLEITIDIIGRSNSIDVEVKNISEIKQLGDNEAKLPVSSDECTGKDYESIEEALRNVGFTDITVTPVYDIIWGITKEKSIKSITVNGNSSFSKGDIIAKNSKIEIMYHMKESDDPSKETQPSPDSEKEEKKLSYSSNDIATAKNGNSGIFSYKNKAGSYDVYYIIDFDAGYVYYFTEGNGSETCDRVKIVSGDLNTVLIITYNDGNEIWSEGLHFKWKNQPDHLIWVSGRQQEFDFYPTNLEEALNIRNKKVIYNY